jgi:hypothetical protein
MRLAMPMKPSANGSSIGAVKNVPSVDAVSIIRPSGSRYTTTIRLL